MQHAYLFKEVNARTAAKKARAGICKHWGCSNPARPGRRDCNTCSSRKQAIKNPARRAFRNLKVSAKKRGIDFSLTFEQFQEFDRQTGYVASTGRDRESLTIDRINPEKGYEAGNIRALTHSENSSRKCDGMTDPAEPIARAICPDGEPWQRYRNKANDVLAMVEILQAQREGGFEPPIDEEDEDLEFLE